jgi:hypothetical protein
MRASASPVPCSRPLRPVPRSRPLRPIPRSRRLRPVPRSRPLRASEIAYLGRIIRDSRHDGSPALGIVNGALMSSVIWAVVIWAFF